MKILYFKAEFCGPCKTTLPIVEKISSEIDDIELNIVDIEDEDNKNLVSEYSIRSIPAMFFLNENDEEIDKHIGSISEKDLIAKINSL